MTHYYNLTPTNTTEQFLVMLNNASNGLLGIGLLIAVFFFFNFMINKEFDIKKLGAVMIITSLVSIFLTLIGLLLDNITISIILITSAIFIYIIMS